MRLPVDELVDVRTLGRGGRAPTPKELRDALPRGWVLEDDGVTARRDRRLLFREGWILVVGMVCFGAVGLGFLMKGMPRGWAGLWRFFALLAILVVVGGLVAPAITRALNRR